MTPKSRKLVRIDLLLDKKTNASLRRLSKRSGHSIGRIIRGGVDLLLQEYTRRKKNIR
jgi:hypothetical protein